MREVALIWQMQISIPKACKLVKRFAVGWPNWPCQSILAASATANQERRSRVFLIQVLEWSGHPQKESEQ